MMALAVVGSGLGRTGTKSLHTALSMIGYGPCHHMIEVLSNPASMPLWIEAAEGRPDWDAIFAGYRSIVDYPGAAYWRELAAYYPDAKVIHSVRDPDAWFESTQATIFAPDSPAMRMTAANPDGVAATFFHSFTAVFGEHLHDRAFMIDYFRRHSEAVVSAIPAERLLIYEVGSGWGPLCEFLDAPLPDAPFPSENGRQQFAEHAAAGAHAMMAHPAH